MAERSGIVSRGHFTRFAEFSAGTHRYLWRGARANFAESCSRIRATKLFIEFRFGGFCFGESGEG